MGSKRGVSAELSLPVPKVVEYLRKLADSLEQGRVYVEHGAEMIALTPSGVVDVEIEAKQKKDREKFVLEMSWHITESPMDASQGLKITSRQPEE